MGVGGDLAAALAAASGTGLNAEDCLVYGPGEEEGEMRRTGRDRRRRRGEERRGEGRRGERRHAQGPMNT